MPLESVDDVMLVSLPSPVPHAYRLNSNLLPLPVPTFLYLLVDTTINCCYKYNIDGNNITFNNSIILSKKVFTGAVKHTLLLFWFIPAKGIFARGDGVRGISNIREGEK